MPDIETHVLFAGLRIGESPRRHDGRLWFGHRGADEIVAVDLDGTSEVMLHDPDLGPAHRRPAARRPDADHRAGSVVRGPAAAPGAGRVMAAVWNHDDPWGGPRTGQVLTARAPSPGAGWPFDR